MEALGELLGVERAAAQKMCRQQPALLMSAPATLAGNWAEIQAWAVPAAIDARAMVVGYPGLLSRSSHNLRVKWESLMAHCAANPGWSLDTLSPSSVGTLLTLAIDRHARLAKVGALAGGPEGMSVSSALPLTDERFDAAFARLEAKCGASEDDCLLGV